MKCQSINKRNFLDWMMNAILCLCSESISGRILIIQKERTSKGDDINWENEIW